MQVEIFQSLTVKQLTEWDSFMSCARHQHPRQTTAFAGVEQKIGHDICFVVGRDGGQVKAIALVSLRRRWKAGGGYSTAAALSGPVCDDVADFEEFLRQLVHVPQIRRVGRLHISPYWLDEEAVQLQQVLDRLGWKSAETKPFRHTGIVNIEANEDELLRAFSKSARREVRRARRQNVKIKHMTTDNECCVLYASLNRLRSRRGLRAISDAEALAQFRDIHSTSRLGIALGAYQNEAFVGGLLIYRSKHTAHGRHFTTEPGTLKRLSNLRISPLLWLSGMAWAHDQGCSWFDLEGYRQDIPRNDPKFAIYKYKGEFNPRPAIRVSEHYFVSNRFLDMPTKCEQGARRAAKAMLRNVRRVPGKNRE